LTPDPKFLKQFTDGILSIFNKIRYSPVPVQTIIPMLISAAHLYNVSEATGVTFSDSNSSTVAKFLNAAPDPGSVIFQI